ncbi:MAG: GTPase Era [Peptococcaceae bacterium]|nr:GTPase Era [Peptococcaceae bacterium]
MKSGFISLIGRPNAGKSTLINQIMERKIAIVSAKPQTTRTRITGIFTTPDAQMVLVDTPGIHKPKHRLDQYMVEAARSTIYEGDVIFYVVDASVPFGPGEKFILDCLAEVDAPVFLLLNKIDMMSPEQIMRSIVQWQTRREFAEIFPLSAERGDNVDRLIETAKGYLMDGPSFYPEDAVTDQPETIVMAELIREKILRLTEEEVPHSVAVVIEHQERDEHDDKLIVHAAIYTERDTQKAIIIGKQGSMIKRIGTAARRDIEELLGEKIYLKLWVRVKANWRNREGMLHDLGYDIDDFND